MKGSCFWDKECHYQHLTLEEIQNIKNKQKRKPEQISLWQREKQAATV
jgi:hypothetical protein